MDPITIATIIAAAAAGAASKAIAEGIKSFLAHRKGTSKIELIGPTGEKTMMSPQEVSRADPASINSSGRFLGLVVLPFIVSTPRHNLYPMKSKGRHGLRIPDATILEIVFRAWGVVGVRKPATSTLH